MEQWRQVVGYEGFYEVSSEGRVFSKYTDDILTPGPDKQGYLQLSLTGADGKVKMHKVHRLVLAAFDAPSDMYVLHNDDDPTNNKRENLRYGTQKENQADAAKRGRRPLGESHVNSKASDANKREAVRLLKTGDLSSDEIAAYFGVSRTTLHRWAKDGRYA